MLTLLHFELETAHFIDDGCGQGRPPRDRFAVANALMAKAVLGISTTVGLIDRLQVDKTLRRLCGFSPFKKLPNEQVAKPNPPTDLIAS